MPGITPPITVQWLHEPTEDAEARLTAAYRLLLERAIAEEFGLGQDFDNRTETRYNGMRQY